MSEQRHEPESELGMLGLRIGRILVAEREKKHRPVDIAQRVNINRGSAHRILNQFTTNRWVDRHLGTGRAMYRLTETGLGAMLDALRPFQIIPLSTMAST